MGIDNFENIFVLLAAIVGLLTSLFRYIEKPRRGFIYLAGFFLSHFLSDYYWAVYSVVIQDDPDVSAFMAYFGWNIGYVLLLLAALHMRDDKAKKYIHPLMFIPIPLNIVQFLIYIQYGGIFNNIWQVSLTTAIACISLQPILYYIKNRKSGARSPFLNSMLLLFVLTEYGMWTSSCYSFENAATDPYYYFAFANYFLMLFLALAARTDYRSIGGYIPEKSPEEIRFQVMIQLIASFLILGGCLGGSYLAVKMKESIPNGTPEAYQSIAVTLFAISLFLVLLVTAFMIFIAIRYKSMEENPRIAAEKKRSRMNLIFTISITLVLMIFSVVYTSRLFYRVSVTGLTSSGEDKAATVSTELENYLSVAVSTLRVTADSVDIMVKNNEPQEKILMYLTCSTEELFKQFDENFTGLYAYVRGEYMDGSGWVPPDGYDPEIRDWYNISKSAGGNTVIVPPYVDAQTNSVVITIGKLISKDQEGPDNVVALDVIVNHIQDVISEMHINGKGTGMLIGSDGLIISHSDPRLTGKPVTDAISRELFDSIINTEKGTLYSVINNTKSTLFINPVMDQWYVVIIVDDNELLQDVYSQLAINVLVSVIIFTLIAFFFYLGYKNEQAYDRKVEEMRISKQEQDYKAQVLELEKAAADEANKAKSSFLADMSHEIRTPINAILGMNEMITREAENKDIREYSKNIGISGRNLLQLINSILDFSKIEDGKMEIVPVPYKVKALISYLMNSISERARAKDLQLILEADPGVPSALFGDDTRINQVIMNLLTNAVKYTPEGSVTFSLREEKRENDRILIHAEVKDTGIGIKEEDMGRLFESFERLDLVKNKNIEGTGLGMSITTRLLSLMDSELKVKSVYGEGSTFYFDLWQKIEDPEPIGEFDLASAVPDDEGPGKEAFHAPSAKILIVDDTKMNLMVAVSLLKRTGIKIDTALSGEEALDKVMNTFYDVIFLDQRMPKMDGTETLSRMRLLIDSPNEDTPVICLTADAIRGARERYIEQGFTDYLTKPVTGQSLEQKLLEYLPEDKVITDFEEDEAPSPDAASSGNTEPKTEEGGASSVNPASDDPLYSALQKAGVDTDNGLQFFGNNEELYRDIITEYARDHQFRSEKLHEFFDNKDWENYTVFIHSLKSSSKTIGAFNLSTIAAGLEAASRDADIDHVEKNHAAAMEAYDTIVEAIKSNIEIDENAGYHEDEDGVVIFD